eukprot:Rhum_TRINITY_DN15193_c4_g1::Rhum_TRINITY_DN15193_c4_g1_i1::g.143158::m.143158
MAAELVRHRARTVHDDHNVKRRALGVLLVQAHLDNGVALPEAHRVLLAVTLAQPVAVLRHAVLRGGVLVPHAVAVGLARLLVLRLRALVLDAHGRRHLGVPQALVVLRARDAVGVLRALLQLARLVGGLRGVPLAVRALLALDALCLRALLHLARASRGVLPAVEVGANALVLKASPLAGNALHARARVREVPPRARRRRQHGKVLAGLATRLRRLHPVVEHELALVLRRHERGGGTGAHGQTLASVRSVHLVTRHSHVAHRRASLESAAVRLGLRTRHPPPGAVNARSARDVGRADPAVAAHLRRDDGVLLGVHHRREVAAHAEQQVGVRLAQVLGVGPRAHAVVALRARVVRVEVAGLGRVVRVSQVPRQLPRLAVGRRRLELHEAHSLEELRHRQGALQVQQTRRSLPLRRDAEGGARVARQGVGRRHVAVRDRNDSALQRHATVARTREHVRRAVLGVALSVRLRERLHRHVLRVRVHRAVHRLDRVPDAHVAAGLTLALRRRNAALRLARALQVVPH